MQNTKKMKNDRNPGTIGYSFESTQRELSNEYQHDRVKMVLKDLCILVLWMKVALVMEGLTYSCLEIWTNVVCTDDASENNYVIEQKFTKYLKESCGLGSK